MLHKLVEYNSNYHHLMFCGHKIGPRSRFVFTIFCLIDGRDLSFTSFGEMSPKPFIRQPYSQTFRTQACLERRTGSLKTWCLQQRSSHGTGTKHRRKPGVSLNCLLYDIRPVKWIKPITPSTPDVPNCCCSKGPSPYWSNPQWWKYKFTGPGTVKMPGAPCFVLGAPNRLSRP